MPRCVDCGTETPREEMYGPPDELRCRACVQRRFPTTNVPTRHRSSFFLRWPPVTTFVVAAAVVVTLLAWSNVEATQWLFAWPPGLWNWQLWRLVTSVLPHASILHLVFNLLWLWRFGKAVEHWMGSMRFAGFVVATAAGPLAAQVLLTGSTGAGLSGVVYALFGLLLALRHDEEFAAELVPPGIIQLFVVWFFICIALTHWNILPVANVAHGAGWAIGWLYGRAVLARWRVAAMAGVSLLCLTLSLATQYMTWDRGFCAHRALQCLRQGDEQAAHAWLQQASGPETLLERWNHMVGPPPKRQ
jgi:membrane associated rhomboid family serine protease